jgi:Arc/MetJ family transcription regulator
MRTTLDLSGDLINELMEITQAKSKTNAVTLAIKAYLRQKKKEELKALSGKIKIAENWRQLRELEIDET